MEFNEKLQELRKSKGLTQEELARDLFVSRTAVSKWESARGYPGIDSLKEIDLKQYNSKSLMRYKWSHYNFLISNVNSDKYLIVHEVKQSTSLDSTIINFLLDFLSKILKEE